MKAKSTIDSEPYHEQPSRNNSNVTSGK